MVSYAELGMLTYYLGEALSYATAGGAGYLAWRAVRAYERRAVAPARLRALARRVRLLEATVEQVDAHGRQTAEAQRFTTSVLLGHSHSLLEGRRPRE